MAVGQIQITRWRYRLVWIALLIWGISACGPKPQVPLPPAKIPPTADAAHYARAQSLERQGETEEARRVYGDYLIRYPQSTRTPAVLLKLGDLLQKAEHYDAARQMYQRLLDSYPQSPQGPAARLGILQSLYGGGDYPAVIENAVEFMPEIEGAGLQAELYALLGDTYLALDSAVDAISQYLKAYLPATPLEREKYDSRIKSAVQRLTPADVRFLFTRHPDDETRGFLMFQMGLRYIEEGDHQEALEVLTRFVEQLPQDPNVALARELIGDIARQGEFNRHTLGCLLPLSGPYQPYGQRILNGIELALSQFANRTPLNDFKLLVRDTASDDSQARQQVGELIQAQVAAIIGPVATAKIAAEAAQAAGIPLIALTQKENIPQIGDYIFRNFMTPELQAETLVSYAVNTLGHRRFAVLYPEEPYGHRFLQAFWKEVTRFGGQITGVEAYPPEQTDFADPIKKLVGRYYPIPRDLRAQYPQLQSSPPRGNSRGDESGPIVDFDALFIPDAPHKAGLIIPQLAYYDIERVQLLGTNLWHSPELIEIAPSFSQGAIIADGFLIDAPGGRRAEFVQRYQSVFLEPPDLLAATGYDSAMLLFTLLSDPRVKFRSSLKSALSTLKNFPGVTGQTAFDPQGEVHKPLFLVQVKGQGFEPLPSPQTSLGAGPAPAM